MENFVHVLNEWPLIKDWNKLKSEIKKGEKIKKQIRNKTDTKKL